MCIDKLLGNGCYENPIKGEGPPMAGAPSHLTAVGRKDCGRVYNVVNIGKPIFSQHTKHPRFSVTTLWKHTKSAQVTCQKLYVGHCRFRAVNFIRQKTRKQQRNRDTFPVKHLLFNPCDFLWGASNNQHYICTIKHRG